MRDEPGTIRSKVADKRFFCFSERDDLERAVTNDRSFRAGHFGEIFENRIASKWLTTKEASLVLGVSENAIRIMVHREQIASYKFGRRLRFRLTDCEALFRKKGCP